MTNGQLLERASVDRSQWPWLLVEERENWERAAARYEALKAERDADAIALAVRALEQIVGNPVEPDGNGLIEDATCCYCDMSSLEGCSDSCPRSIAADALAALKGGGK